MQIKPIISFNQDKKIWKMLVAAEDSIIMEIRDSSEFTTEYLRLNLNTGKTIFSYKPSRENWRSGLNSCTSNEIIVTYLKDNSNPEIIGFEVVDFNKGKSIFYSTNVSNINCIIADKKITYTDAQGAPQVFELKGTSNEWTELEFPQTYNQDSIYYKEFLLFSEKYFNKKNIQGPVEYMEWKDTLFLSVFTDKHYFFIYRPAFQKEIILKEVPTGFSDALYFRYKNAIYALVEQDTLLKIYHE